MSQKKSIEERLEVQKQKKALVAQTDALLREAARKERLKKLIKVGVILEKAGLLDCADNTLFGASLWVRDLLKDKIQKEALTAAGGRAFAEEARQRNEGKEALLLIFPAPLSKEAAKALRQAGFQFSKVCCHWEGFGHFDEAQTLAEKHGGVARKVGEANASGNAIKAPDAKADADPGPLKTRANGAGHGLSVSALAETGQPNLFDEEKV